MLSDLEFAVANAVIYDLDYVHYSALGDRQVREQILDNSKGAGPLSQIAMRLVQKYEELPSQVDRSEFSSDAERIISEINKNIPTTQQAREDFSRDAPVRVANALKQTKLITSGALKQGKLSYFLGRDSDFRAALVHPYALYELSIQLMDDPASELLLEEIVETHLSGIAQEMNANDEAIARTNSAISTYYVGWDTDIIRETARAEFAAQFPDRKILDAIIVSEQWFRHEAWAWDPSRNGFCRRDYWEIPVRILWVRSDDVGQYLTIMLRRDHADPAAPIKAEVQTELWLPDAPDLRTYLRD